MCNNSYEVKFILIANFSDDYPEDKDQAMMVKRIVWDRVPQKGEVIHLHTEYQMTFEIVKINTDITGTKFTALIGNAPGNMRQYQASSWALEVKQALIDLGWTDETPDSIVVPFVQ